MKTIEITTTQNVTIEYEVALIRERILAQAIDIMIVGAIWFVIYIVLLIAFQAGSWVANFGMVIQLFTAIFVGYHLFCESLFHGQSVGKVSLGLKVMKMNGRQPKMGDYLLRAVFQIIDMIYSVGVLGVLLISSTNRGQRLGDLAANTVVIRTKFIQHFTLNDIASINSIENYEPQFPEVRQFSEEDMLLIKSVLTRHRVYANKAHNEVLNELASDLALRLDLVQIPRDKVRFLRTLIRDYIVLTR